MSARHHDINGWRAITIENEHLALTVLPERGAEIHSIVDRATGIDLLFHAPWGLAPPGAAPRAGADGHRFLETYAGGWQELFPSMNGPCEHGGATIPFHGEVATIPWQVHEFGPTDLVCSVRCETVPFELHRRIALSPRDDGAVGPSEPVVGVYGVARNLSDEPQACAWGQHLVIGPPFLEDGCVFEPAAATIVTIPELWEETARLEPDQRSAWPNGQLRVGGTVDLSHVPGPEAGSHDDVYLTDLDSGLLRVTNPRLGRALTLRWDARTFPWIISWQAYGGCQAPPLAGSYALGIEPWTVATDLATAVRDGTALVVPPRGEIGSVLFLELEDL